MIRYISADTKRSPTNAYHKISLRLFVNWIQGLLDRSRLYSVVYIFRLIELAEEYKDGVFTEKVKLTFGNVISNN